MSQQVRPKQVRGALRFLTREEAAAAIGCGMSQLRKLIASGAIRSVRVGPHTVRIAASELERFAREGGVSK